jgi:manganese transport protein
VKGLLAVIFWSVISAAFLGPGTVTTAAVAGVSFRYALLWALAFSTIACLLLQEAAARLTVVSGRDLGQAIRAQYPTGAGRLLASGLALAAIVVGCAAYEAGNLLGAVAGAGLSLETGPRTLTLVIGGVAACLLWIGTPALVARLLSLAVALMGVAFLVTAFLLRPPPGAVVAGTLAPGLPAGSGLVALGLLGTTVVPYNLFLGSGLARGQDLREARLGLAVAISLGGLISMGVLCVGAAVDGPFSFQALATLLAGRLGGWAGDLFAWGLFAAGFSSAVTAPLAAALTARGLLAREAERTGWGARGWRYRGVWGVVLASGLLFGVSGVHPVPAIVAAQALNGLLLPLAAVFLLGAVNDRRLMGEAVNGALSNSLMALVVAVSLLLGLLQLGRAGATLLGLPSPEGRWVLAAAAALTVLLAVPVGRWVARRRALGQEPASAGPLAGSRE